MEPAGGDPGQGHQAQAGSGVSAEPAAGRRATAVAAASAAAAVAPVPQPGRREGAVRGRRPAAAGHGEPGLGQVAVAGGGRTAVRLQRVPVARGRPETRAGRAAGPSYRDGGGESVERGADPPAAGRAQVGRVREQGAGGPAVRQRQAVFRGGHVDREEII